MSLLDANYLLFYQKSSYFVFRDAIAVTHKWKNINP